MSLDAVTDFLTVERLSALMVLLRLLFLGLLVGVLIRLVTRPVPKAGPSAWAGHRVLAVGTGLMLVAAFLYQGTWQLAGFTRPAFVRFMQAHNPRPDAETQRVRRGRLLDHRGQELAAEDPERPPARRYALGRAGGHVIGYADSAYGLTGVERVQNASLMGHSVLSLKEVDRFGRNLLDHKRAVGNDITLTLDTALQRRAYALMAGRPGAIVALDPRNGAIRALVSSPSFDPNALDAGLFQAAGAPLFNRALHGLYPPGSVFKIVIAALALESGAGLSIACPAEGFRASPGARAIRDHEYYAAERDGRQWRGHGTIGLNRAFAYSSNVYFAKLGLTCGAEAWNGMREWPALWQRVAVCRGPSGALACSAANLPKVSADERRELAQMSIGQGRVLLTPLHAAMLAGVVAAEGVLWQPRLNRMRAPESLGQVMRPLTAELVKGLMRETVQYGTATQAELPGLAVCGKTGTAQAAGGEDHSWFVCFAPADRPMLALAVLVERGGYGSRSALPVAVELLKSAERLGLLHETEPTPPGTMKQDTLPGGAGSVRSRRRSGVGAEFLTEQPDAGRGVAAEDGT